MSKVKKAIKVPKLQVHECDVKRKHTPGPWFVNKDAPFQIHSELGSMVAECQGNSALVKANARLIAAAPDMLLALQRAIEHHELHGFIDLYNVKWIRDAIKKATRK